MTTVLFSIRRLARTAADEAHSGMAFPRPEGARRYTEAGVPQAKSCCSDRSRFAAEPHLAAWHAELESHSALQAERLAVVGWNWEADSGRQPGQSWGNSGPPV